MTRSPLSIALAVISVILIVAGRVNRDAPWGTWALLAGFAVLAAAGILTLVRKP